MAVTGVTEDLCQEVVPEWPRDVAAKWSQDPVGRGAEAPGARLRLRPVVIGCSFWKAPSGGCVGCDGRPAFCRR